MIEALALAAATFAHVSLKAAQQLNVVHHRLWWVPPTSLLLAAVEVYVVVRVAASGWGLGVVLPMALGGASGCMLVMVAHKRIRERRTAAGGRGRR